MISNNDYCWKVLPYLKEEYFSNPVEKQVFSYINAFIKEYKVLPSYEAISITINSDTINEEMAKKCNDLVHRIAYDVEIETDTDWLLDVTEEWCRNNAYENVVRTAIELVYEADAKKRKITFTRTDIPKLLTEANSISFDPSIGHDYLEDSDVRYSLYTAEANTIPTDLTKLDEITNGGWENGTLNVFIAGPGAGKTMLMCHLAANNLSRGHNVLYITLEISESRISQRIDSNLLNVSMKDFKTLPKDIYDKKIQSMRNKVKGKLIVKQYPTTLASSETFRNLLNEIRLKKGYTPDIVYVDYLNLTASSRYKRGVNNSYDYVKGVAEELRGLASEYNFPLVTATQLNREGFKSSDVDMHNTSESFGVPATADCMIAILSDETLEKMGQIKMKVLKNRYGELGPVRNIYVGVDRSKMRFFDLDADTYEKIEKQQVKTKKEKTVVEGEVESDKSVFDNTSFGRGMRAERKRRRGNYDDVQI